MARPGRIPQKGTTATRPARPQLALLSRHKSLYSTRRLAAAPEAGGRATARAGRGRRGGGGGGRGWWAAGRGRAAAPAAGRWGGGAVGGGGGARGGAAGRGVRGARAWSRRRRAGPAAASCGVTIG